MSNPYAEYIVRAQRKWGDSLDISKLANQFKPYFSRGVRIKVRTIFGEVTGTVGVSTGWCPIFLLMTRSNAIGSCITLDKNDTIVAVQRGRTYFPVTT